MGLVAEVTDALTTELRITEGDKFNEALLKAKVNGAFREIKAARRYPSDYTDAMIEKDMERYYANLLEIARFDYNQVGSEGQTSYSADGTSIHYVDRDKLFYGIIPIAVTS